RSIPNLFGATIPYYPFFVVFCKKTRKNVEALIRVKFNHCFPNLSIFILILLFSYLQTGCSSKSEIAEYKSPVSIYLLSAGKQKIPMVGIAAEEVWFTRVKNFSAVAAQDREFVPWPQAVRVSDIAETENGTIVILINKKGVAVVNEAAVTNNSLLFSSKITHESLSSYTSGKIITDLGAGSNSILCHIFVDSFFVDNPVPPFSPFIKIDFDYMRNGAVLTGNAVYSQHNYPAAVNNFSLIDLKKVNNEWYSAWKKSDATRTMFKYFTHSSAVGENASEITETRFRFANRSLSESNFSDKLKEFISNVIKNEANTNSVIELKLRSKNNPVVMTYLLRAAGDDSRYYKKICVAAAQGRYFISYNGKIYLIENDNLYLLSGVEKLPHGFRYTALYASGNKLYAAWEQQNFFLTGASGLTLIDIKRVDKIPQ
ncbi:MAG: hypothetical protein FWC36_03385, partial [Spirochaetes bacterium]|nr:hypothetical protein [Spirochaetota bacterium]